MGDGSAAMQSIMLLSGTAGNGMHSVDGCQLAVDPSDYTAGSSSTLQTQDKQQIGQSNGHGWMLNGFSLQPPDTGQAQQQHQYINFSTSMPQQQLQQFEFPRSLPQQSVSQTQAQLGAQMASLHATFGFQQHQQQQELVSTEQHLQQQVAMQRAKAVVAATGLPAQQGRLSSDGQWFGNAAVKQQSQQQPHQHQQGAVSALRQHLMQQQQQLQSQQPQQQIALDQQPVTNQLLPIQGALAAAGQQSGTISSQQLASSSSTAAARVSNLSSRHPQINGSSSNSKDKGPPSSNLTVRMTVQLVSTYTRCTPQSSTAAAAGSVPQALPRRVLTKPGVGVKNDGWDNEASDLVLCTQDVLVNAAGQRYVVLDMLGSGTFGQVVSCYSESEGKPVAVKVIKNQPAYYHQARVEVGILQLLNGRCDPQDAHHIVRLQDAFLHKRHLCLAFEQLGINLFELLKRNGFRGISLGLLRLFLQQILDALIILRDASIIHCDLKPENILLAPPAASGGALGQLKLIDFGSACFERRTVYSYIQSRFYRSPEVMLGLSYTAAIDMWSFGCVAAELFLGLPLFPGASEHDLLSRIIESLGPPPPWMMAAAKRTSAFFKKVPRTSQHAAGHAGVDAGDGAVYVLHTKEEFEAANGCQAPAGKRYFTHTRLADIIGHYPFKQGASDAEEAQERKQREALLDLLLGVLDLDPKTRWTPRQAIKHPFITGEPFTGPYQPAADSPPQLIHHHHHYHHHQQRHQHHHHHHQQQQSGLARTPQQQFAAAAAAAAAVAAAGSYSAGQDQLVGSLGAADGAVRSTRTGPVAMQAPSAAHHQQQQQYAAAAAAAGMLQATPPSSFLGGHSFPTAGPGSFVAGSTSQLLQYSPAAAQVHARAHAIAMAALQQLSPQLGSSFQAPNAAQLLGSSVSNRSTGSYMSSGGMNLVQQQQQQSPHYSSSLSPARPLIPSGRSAGSAAASLRQQQQQQATAMVTSPAPPGRSGFSVGVRTGSSERQPATVSAGAAVGEFLNSSGSLAQSFNHNLLMSPVSPAHINNVAAMIAAARQQQQQQQQQQAAAAAAAMASSMGKGSTLQQRWRAAMDQAGPSTAINMQFNANSQQQQQQQQYGASWQQPPAVGFLGQSVAPAVDTNVMLQWQQQQIQQAQMQQSSAAAAAAALAAKAAASAAGGGGGGFMGLDSSAASLPSSARLSNAVGSGGALPVGFRDSSGDGVGAGSSQGHRQIRHSSSGGVRRLARVSSADDVMFVMEEGPGSGRSSRQQQHDDQQQQRSPGSAVLHHNHQGQHLAARPELIASSPLELCPIEEQRVNMFDTGSGQAAQAQHLTADGGLQAVLQSQQQQQQQHQAGDDLELQEEEVMCEEHPGDWNPLYTDEQLLEEHSSPSPPAAALPATALGVGHNAGLFAAGPGALVEAALAATQANAAAAAAPAVVPDAGGLQSRNRRGSLLQVRCMSVELPGMSDGGGCAGISEADVAGMDVVRPSVAGGSAGSTPDEELEVTLGAHWSFRPPHNLLQNPVHFQQQQEIAAAGQPALLWSGGAGSSQPAGDMGLVNGSSSSVGPVAAPAGDQQQ